MLRSINGASICAVRYTSRCYHSLAVSSANSSIARYDCFRRIRSASNVLIAICSLSCAPRGCVVRFSHSDAPVTGSSKDLLGQLCDCVPSTFTSVPQLSRQLPPAVMEQLRLSESGGLPQFFRRFPDVFECRHIGQVPVVRQRVTRLPHRHHSQPSSSRLRPGQGLALQAGERNASSLSSSHLSSAALHALQRRFPRFLVPVKALWETAPETAKTERRAEVLSALRAHRGARLVFHQHPAHRIEQRLGGSGGCGETPAATEDALDAVLEEGYVRLADDCSAGSLVPPLPGDSGTTDASCRSTLQPEEDEDDGSSSNDLVRLAAYEVQPYEWYRVARLLPTARAEVHFDTPLQQASTALLPPGRDVWQVLLSAPHLFAVRYGSHALSPTESVAEPEPPRVFVRFQLDDRYIPPGIAAVEEATLLEELEAIASAARNVGAGGWASRQRRHKRRLQRQLAYLRNPTPYFDERVLAQHLFDLLPMGDGVQLSALLRSLPSHAAAAFPASVPDMLKGRRDLFRLCDAHHGVEVRRADDHCGAGLERSVSSVTAEEVVQCLFTAFSHRSDPRDGTTISRCLPRLPRLIRERLFTTQDAVEEVLGRYPDKVEVMHDASPFASELDARTRRELRSVRGRRDFLIPFRFVGEWEGKLRVQYDRRQEKERGRHTQRRPRPTSYRRR